MYLVFDRAGCAMYSKGLSRGFALFSVWSTLAWGQTLPTSARIESIPLELTMPERYQVAEASRANPASDADRARRRFRSQYRVPPGLIRA